MKLHHQTQDWRSETSSQFATHFSPSQRCSVLLAEVLLSSQQQYLNVPVKNTHICIYFFKKWHLLTISNALFFISLLCKNTPVNLSTPKVFKSQKVPCSSYLHMYTHIHTNYKTIYISIYIKNWLPCFKGYFSCPTLSPLSATLLR